MATVGWLRELPLFAGFPEATLVVLSHVVHRKRVPARHNLFHEGDPATTLYYIERGRIRITITREDGDESTINILGDGEFFPHTGLLSGGYYPATATCMGDTDLAFILKDDLFALVRQDPEIGFHLLLEMGKRIQILQGRICELMQRDLRMRVLYVLMRLAKMHLSRESAVTPRGETVIDCHLTHEEISRLAGGARESVSRILADLRHEGIITHSSHGRVGIRMSCLENALARSRYCPLLPSAPSPDPHRGTNAALRTPYGRLGEMHCDQER